MFVGFARIEVCCPGDERRTIAEVRERRMTATFLGVTLVSEITRVEKPWGYELHWAKTERYVGKIIHVNAGHALSLQYHNLKDETIYLQSGKLLFEIHHGPEVIKREMLPGERVHIAPKTVHRMTAIEDSDIFEVSTPELHDVVRLEDRYGRSS
jgi:quercetin dioxygenase-like cupin family protein